MNAPEPKTPRKFKDFSRILGILDDNLALALICVSPDSAYAGLFTAFPEVLCGEIKPIHRNLLDKMERFGLWRTWGALKKQGYPVFLLTYRSPQGDFDGDIPPKGVGIEQLEAKSFVVEAEVEGKGKPYVVFRAEKTHPFPTTVPQRYDKRFYCIAESFILGM